MKTETIENVPEWATMYLMYGDTTGLDETDLESIRSFVEGLKGDGLRLVDPIDGTHNEFCRYPEFGLPCATQDWTAVYA